MTSRERVINALNYKEVDRLPTSLGGSAHKLNNKAFFQLLKYFNLDEKESHKELTGAFYSYYHTGLWESMGVDIIYVNMKPPLNNEDWNSVNAFREWGIMAEIKYGLINYTDYALKDVNEIYELKEKLKTPSPEEENRVKDLYENTKQLYDNTDFAIGAYRPIPAGIFELSQAYFGMEKLFLSFYDNPDLVHALFDELLQAQILFYKRQLDAIGEFVQIVEIADDLGSQNSPLISPEIYRAFLKPAHAKLVKYIKQKALHVKILIHSCGSVEPFIDDFIDIGIDILNPMQPRAYNMEPCQLKEKYSGRICFEGGIDVQQTMLGNTEKVQKEVRNRVKTFGTQGGYILAPSHNLGEDVPLKNIITLFKEI